MLLRWNTLIFNALFVLTFSHVIYFYLSMKECGLSVRDAQTAVTENFFISKSSILNRSSTYTSGSNFFTRFAISVWSGD